jgi:hypothetical protein
MLERAIILNSFIVLCQITSTPRGTESFTEFSMIFCITSLIRVTVARSSGHVNQMPPWKITKVREANPRAFRIRADLICAYSGRSVFKVHRQRYRQVHRRGHDLFHDFPHRCRLVQRCLYPHGIVNTSHYSGVHASCSNFAAEPDQRDLEKMRLDLL